MQLRTWTFRLIGRLLWIAVGYALGSRPSSFTTVARPKAVCSPRGTHTGGAARIQTPPALPSPEQLQEGRPPSLETWLQMARDEDEADLTALAEHLRDTVTNHPELLSEALKRFQTERDPKALKCLALTLAWSGGQEAIDVAITMANDPMRSLDARTAAVHLLGWSGNRDRLHPVASVMASTTESPLIRACLYAMPDAYGYGLQDAAAVRSHLLAGPLVSQDPEIRAKALVVLGGWAGDRTDLGPILSALRSDPDPTIRAAAAFSLSGSGVKDEFLLRELSAVILNTNEHWQVREHAWRALGSFGLLPPHHAEVYTAFEKEQRTHRAGSNQPVSQSPH